ncbi:MAG: hypothetical protein DRO00_01055 [Thermoproteota archaeon]|nr:MAG: hypothetical protein DRO00_01055 [Candidatus Korarchaeota archaeon]
MEALSSSSVFFTFLLTVTLPSLYAILRGPTLDTAQSYGILAIGAWIFLLVTTPSWLNFKGLLSILTFGINIVVMFASGWFASTIASEQAGKPMAILPLSMFMRTVEVTYVTLLMALLIGWSEELVFGGLAYRILRAILGRFGGAIATGLLFGFMHLPAYPNNWLILAPIITRIIQCFLIEMEGGLFGVALAHSVGDGILLLAMGGLMMGVELTQVIMSLWGIA